MTDAALQALREKATPGPWTVCANDEGNPKIGLPPCRWTWINEVQGGAAGRMTIADAEFIVALVNAYDSGALADAVIRQRVERWADDPKNLHALHGRIAIAAERARKTSVVEGVAWGVEALLAALTGENA